MKNMSTAQRREKIRELIAAQGNVSVTELAGIFGISEVTVRGDLNDMERTGLLRRIRGGAVSTAKMYYEMSLNDRMEVNRLQKISVAKACASLIKDGDIIMIDSGTTTCYLAKELSERGNLTVLTNALQVADEFRYNRSVNVILLGGNLDARYRFTYGNDVVTQLQKYRADKAIIATDGLSAEHGLTTYHHQELDVTRMMIERSNEVLVVADHSKIGKEGFSYITGISDLDILVTDTEAANNNELKALSSLGIRVVEAQGV